MYCICCKKNNVSPIFVANSVDGKTPSEEDILWKETKRKDGSLVNVNNEMINNGIIHIIDSGYGSAYDGDQFLIAICDDCIKDNLQDATLLYWGNYMYDRDGHVEKEREKSKVKYRRRSNLDNLTK